MTRFPIAAAFVLLALSGAAEAADPVAAEIKLFMFKPKDLTVAPGTTVTWTNGDAIQHSVTSGTPDAPGGAFDSGFFTKGQSYSFTFTEPGEYPYFCARHKSLQGVVKVEPAS